MNASFLLGSGLTVAVVCVMALLQLSTVFTDLVLLSSTLPSQLLKPMESKLLRLPLPGGKLADFPPAAEAAGSGIK